MTRKKQVHRNNGTRPTENISQAKKSTLSMTGILIPIFLALVLVMGFPEITQAGYESLLRLTRGEHTSEVGKETVTNVAAPEVSQTQAKPDVPQEIKDFNPTYQKNLTTKKIFLEGRRIAPMELLPQKNVSTNHSVKVYLFDDFLSAEECDGLRGAHDKHVKMWSNTPPLLCFESIDTLRKNLRNVKQTKVKVTPQDFTPGTYCLNASFSHQVADWMSHNWSYSTAFYPDETPFSKKMAALIHETTGLKKENGGKFQLTSYPLNVGYKKHTDCTENTEEMRDRMATVLVYLDDVAEGGETSFPELGIWVKPRKGRALVWNNMNENGECDPISIHQANKVTKGHKYIIQRWYYYESFWSLGRRPQAPHLPDRTEDQAMVSCDEYKHGSCRWYDEWSYDILQDYRDNKITLV